MTPTSSRSATTSTMEPPILFIDNGGDTVKAMFLPARATDSPALPVEPRFLVVPNCVGASPVGGEEIVGAQLRELPHFHGFTARRPVADGVVVDVARQARVWEYILECFHINPHEEARTEVWLTCPHGASPPAARAMWELLTQHFRFDCVVLVSATLLSLVAGERDQSESSAPVQAAATTTVRTSSRKRSRAAAAALAEPPMGNGVVIDMGHSATTIVPYIDYTPITSSIVRLDVGGKLLGDRLREHLSFAQTDLHEDGWLVQHVMMTCCYVPPVEGARDKAKEGTVKTRAGGDVGSSSATLRHAKSRRYFLPSLPALYPLGCTEDEVGARLNHLKGSTGGPTGKGSGMDNDGGGQSVDTKVLPVLWLREECTYIPSLLFAPHGAGMAQLGLVPGILHATMERGLLGTTRLLWAVVLSHLYVSGGTSQFPHLLQRLEMELRAALPSASITAPWTFHATSARLTEDGGCGGELSPPPDKPTSGASEIPVVKGEGIGSVVICKSVLQPLRGAAWLLTSLTAEPLRDRVAGRTRCYLQGSQQASVAELIEALERML